MENPTISAAKVKKTKTIGCKVTQAEYDEFCNKAKLANITVSDFFRRAVIGNATFVVQQKVMTEDQKQLVYLFNKTANNLNQLARAMNLNRKEGKVTPMECLRFLRDLQLIRTYFRDEIDDYHSERREVRD